MAGPAYRASWEPKNNFYGLYLVSNDELVNAALQKTNAAAAEAEAASGFLSTKNASNTTFKIPKDA